MWYMMKQSLSTFCTYVIKPHQLMSTATCFLLIFFFNIVPLYVSNIFTTILSINQVTLKRFNRFHKLLVNSRCISRWSAVSLLSYIISQIYHFSFIWIENMFIYLPISLFLRMCSNFLLRFCKLWVPQVVLLLAAVSYLEG